MDYYYHYCVILVLHHTFKLTLVELMLHTDKVYELQILALLA